VPIPFFNRNQGRIAEAEANVGRAAREAEAGVNDVLLELQEDHRRYTIAGERVRRYQVEILPRAALSLEQARVGYQAGKLRFIDVLDAQRTLGDARALLTALDFVVTQQPAGPDGTRLIDGAALEAALIKKSIRYDKSGEEHYNAISAYIKSLRDSDPDGALYWLARMLEGGEDPLFIARRLVIFASEDVGNADPMGLVVAAAVAQAVQFVGFPEAQLNLAQGTTYLATRQKDNASYIGLLEAMEDAKTHGNLGVPLHLRNAVTSMMKGFGYGKGYRYVHDDPEAKVQEHLPESLKGRRYYRPKDT
jgi:replication-associated recombination protein RarA